MEFPCSSSLIINLLSAHMDGSIWVPRALNFNNLAQVNDYNGHKNSHKN